MNADSDVMRTISTDDDSSLPTKLWLIDRSPALVTEWKTSFAVFSEVAVLAGDYFQQPADAIVSPANSFGIMDGGLDLAIRDQLGYSIQGKIQDVITDKYHGELPIGSAEIVETGDPRWKYMVAAPTMRVPESVAFTINAYLAFRAVLVAVENFNRRLGSRVIGSLVCCGLGTGVGGMSASKCARQMRLAYQNVVEPSMIRRFESIHEFHKALVLT
jgi:O-acetyl-ADP-ribose deacetylase (regulator of RNase III)